MPLINAIVENGNNTLVVDFPRNIYDLYGKLRSIGVQTPLHEIPLTDNEEDTIKVKLYADSDIGNHLILLLKEKNTLQDVNIVASVVANSDERIRDELEQQIIYDQYDTVEDLYQDIRQLTYDAGTLSNYYYFPLTGNVYDSEYGDSYEVGNGFLVDYEDDIRKCLEAYMDRDTNNMAEYYDGSGKEKVLLADWDLEYLNGRLYGKVEVRLTEPMTDSEREQLKDWICGQNSDGAGEGFEQQDIPTEDGDLNVSFWNSRDDYFIYTQEEMDEYIANQNDLMMGGM